VLLEDVHGLPLSLLARRGAFHASDPDYAYGRDDNKFMYTLQDLSNIVAYAADRGIEVVPELDVPAHSL
jgi:N-acetyl-beta-hexosaminidase